MHFSGVIECVILVDRLKNFIPFVKRVFNISPKKITIILLCILFNNGAMTFTVQNKYEFSKENLKKRFEPWDMLNHVRIFKINFFF